MLTYDCPGCGGWHYHPDSSLLCKFLATIVGHYTPTEDDIKKIDAKIEDRSGVDKPAATDQIEGSSRHRTLDEAADGS